MIVRANMIFHVLNVLKIACIFSALYAINSGVKLALWINVL